MENFLELMLKLGGDYPAFGIRTWSIVSWIDWCASMPPAWRGAGVRVSEGLLSDGCICGVSYLLQGWSWQLPLSASPSLSKDARDSPFVTLTIEGLLPDGTTTLSGGATPIITVANISERSGLSKDASYLAGSSSPK